MSLALLITTIGCAQVPTDRPKVASPDFDAKLTGLLRFSVPVIGVEELMQRKDEFQLLDTREIEEYQVSHINGARFVGYKSFDLSSVQDIPKDTPIVLYCSVGYRSEKVGKKLQEAGYTKVYNLYGSMFEWVNQGGEIVDNQGDATKKVHTYNQSWSKWVIDSTAKKVW